MHLVLTGATGMVGSAALAAMVRDPAITRVSILSRKQVPQATDTPEANQKCVVHIHQDFAKPPSSEVLSQLQGAQGAVWALGVSVTDVSKEDYENITVQFPMTFARSFATLNGKGPFNFVYVSGEGATTNPGRMTPRFGSVKGQAEAALLALSKENVYADQLRVFSARPGGVTARSQPEIQKYWQGRLPWYKDILIQPLGAVLSKVYPPIMSPTTELGAALVKLAAGDGSAMPAGPGIEGEGRTLANVALRKIMGI